MPIRPPDEVVFVGGTASNLVKLLVRSGHPEFADRLDRAALELVRDLVRTTPAEALAAAYAMREARVRLLAAGAAIVETVFDRVGIDHGRVSESGLREGAIIAADRAGAAGVIGSTSCPTAGWADRDVRRDAGSAERRLAQRPASVRPSDRRNRIPATPRQAGPTVRWSRTTSFSRLTR